VLDLPRHDGAGDALGFESVDEFRQLAQRKPSERSGAVRLDLGEASSRIAATTTSNPAARAASSIRKGTCRASDETETCHVQEHVGTAASAVHPRGARQPRYSCARQLPRSFAPRTAEGGCSLRRQLRLPLLNHSAFRRFNER